MKATVPSQQETTSAKKSAPERLPLKVAFVSETWRPEINGVTHTMSELVAQLAMHGYEMQLVRPAPEDGAVDEHMEAELHVRALPVFDYDGVHMGFIRPHSLYRYWQAQRPDVIYIATEGPLGMIALRVARQLNIPIVSGYHTNFDLYSRYYILLRVVRPFVRTFLRSFHNKTQTTLVPTRHQAEQMHRAGYTNVQVMGRGLDTHHFSPIFRSSALRHEWKAGDDDCVALHVGRLAVEKNVALLISTLQAMRKANPHQIAVIVGDGPLRDKLISEVPWVHLAGFKRGDELSRHYASADMFLFPSLSETFGNVVAEAMASGLATIAFDYAAANELIENGMEGVKVPCNDQQAFIEAAVELAGNIGSVRQQGKRASSKVAELSWEKIGATFMKYLHQAQEVNDAR